MRYNLIFNNNCTRFRVIDAISGVYMMIMLLCYYLFYLLLCLGWVLS